MGIVVPHLHQYHHLGDAINETDNLLYDSTLKPYEVKGNRSGTLDDRWAFTERTTFLDYYTAAALAAASRALKGFNDTLSDQSLFYAKQLWNEDDSISKMDTSGFQNVWKRLKMTAALQLYITTKDEQYATVFKNAVWQSLDRSFQIWPCMPALQAVPYMDDDYKKKLRDYVVKYKASIDDYAKQNPYGVPIAEGGWGGSGGVVNFATANYYANKFYPDIINRRIRVQGIELYFWLPSLFQYFFCFFCRNKIEESYLWKQQGKFSFIAGGIVPGILVFKPDFPENKEDWPFFWGENEVTVGGCADYILLGTAVNQMSGGK